MVGVGFWFLVGFPFANHNESYYWLSRFEEQSFSSIVWTHTLAATFSLLGQGLAYVGWRLSDGSNWPIQRVSGRSRQGLNLLYYVQPTFINNCIESVPFLWRWLV